MDAKCVCILLICFTYSAYGASFPYPHASRQTLRFVPRADQPDPGEPLVLTDYIEKGEIDQGLQQTCISIYSVFIVILQHVN